MKIAISGKGGVGKTTISALIARALADKNQSVLAVDADADANLASALGLDLSEGKIKPIAELEELIEEKMGTGDKTGQGLYVMNPSVADIPENFSVESDGVKFLAAGTVKTGGRGCYCAENKLLKRLINHLILQDDEAIVIDMEAGLEHFSRGTGEGVDLFLVVIEPGMRSIETALDIKKMAEDIGVKKVYGILNKVRNQEEVKLVKERLTEIEILAELPYNPEIARADLEGISPAQAVNEDYKARINHILESI